MVAASVRLVLALVGGIMLAGASQAQDEGLLTPATVENFIASYPEMKGKVDELRAQYDVPGGLSGAAAWRAWTDVDGAKSQLDGVAAAHGFSDFSAWVRTLSVTAQAYAFTQSGDDLESRIAEALARIENDPRPPEGDDAPATAAFG